MSTDERYNGWANRETWAVALHINNDQGWQESVHETVRNTCRCPTCADMGAWLTEPHHHVTFKADGVSVGHVPARHLRS